MIKRNVTRRVPAMETVEEGAEVRRQLWILNITCQNTVERIMNLKSIGIPFDSSITAHLIRLCPYVLYNHAQYYLQ